MHATYASFPGPSLSLPQHLHETQNWPLLHQLVYHSHQTWSQHLEVSVLRRRSWCHFEYSWVWQSSHMHFMISHPSTHQTTRHFSGPHLGTRNQRAWTVDHILYHALIVQKSLLEFYNVNQNSYHFSCPCSVCCKSSVPPNFNFL